MGLLFWGISARSGFFWLNVAYADAPLLALLGGIGGSYVLMFSAYRLCHRTSLPYVAYYGKMSLAVLCIHLIEIGETTAAGHLYRACLLWGVPQWSAVTIEIIYRTIVTIIFIVLLPHIPVLRSFYLNRQYPFSKKIKKQKAKL